MQGVAKQGHCHHKASFHGMCLLKNWCPCQLGSQDREPLVNCIVGVPRLHVLALGLGEDACPNQVSQVCGKGGVLGLPGGVVSRDQQGCWQPELAITLASLCELPPPPTMAMGSKTLHKLCYKH